MGLNHYSFNQDIPSGWSLSNTICKNPQEWVRWGIPLYSNACARDTRKSTQNPPQRKIPPKEWGRDRINVRADSEFLTWLHWRCLLEKDCEQDVWQRWCLDIDCSFPGLHCSKKIFREWIDVSCYEREQEHLALFFDKLRIKLQLDNAPKTSEAYERWRGQT